MLNGGFMKKVINVFVGIIIVLLIVFIIWFILEVKEMLNDHRCYNLPLNEFYQDKKCERYWDLKEWKN